MKSLSCVTRIAGFFLAGGCIAASEGVSAGYLLTELTLGGKYSFAYDLNNSGEVVGEAYSPSGNFRAFITGPNGVGIRDLGTFEDGNNSRASAINERGQVVGDAELGGIPHAFITGPDGAGLMDLGTFGGDFSVATGVNDYGQVVVNALTFGESSVYYSAFFTGANGVGITSLVQPGEAYSYARDINNAGQIVWEASWGGFISGNGGVGRTELGDLYTGYAGNSSTPNAINDLGQVVGNAIAGLPFSTQAFITDANGLNMRGLGTLGGNASYAYDINESGEVVGLSSDSHGLDRAFVTGANGSGITDLNSLVTLPQGVYLRHAQGINDMGQIIATDNLGRSYLLTHAADATAVVSEPTTTALLALGLLGFMITRRKQVV